MEVPISAMSLLKKESSWGDSGGVGSEELKSAIGLRQEIRARTCRRRREHRAA